MATKQQQSINLIDIFSEFKELKSIDRQTFINVLGDSFRNVITKMYGTDANYDVIINPDKGDLEIYRNRLVMEDDDGKVWVKLRDYQIALPLDNYTFNDRAIKEYTLDSIVELLSSSM